MKEKRIFIFFFSILYGLSIGQQKKPAVPAKEKYKPNFSIGIDLLNSVTAPFSERKLVQGFISSNIRGRWYGIADLGFEKNIYQKNGYDATAQGPLLKLGVLYMVTSDPENPRNGLIGGGKLATSFYKQQYFAIPVRGFGESTISQSVPESRQSSYWVEASIGGRVALFESPFFIEVTAQPRYLLATTKQENIIPMIVPGFGKSAGKFNLGFSWNIAYTF